MRYIEQKGLNRLKDLDLEQHLDTSHDVVRAIEPPKEETEKPKHRRRKKSSSASAKRKPAKDATPERHRSRPIERLALRARGILA